MTITLFEMNDTVLFKLLGIKAGRFNGSLLNFELGEHGRWYFDIAYIVGIVSFFKT